MSGSGGGDVVHGAGVPTPPWWRPFRDLPLIILAILALAAAIIGWTVQSRIDQAGAVPAPVTPTAGATPASASACRPSVSESSAQPWIGQDAAASQTWDENVDLHSDPVVLGREGWAFYNDQIEDNFSQSIGRRFLTVGEVSAWTDYFTSLQTALAEQGIELSIQISPSQASVYPQMLPEWTDDIRGSTPLDQLLVAAPDLPIVDFRASLREAAPDDAVYTPVNTHWTDWGGYVAWQEFARCHAALHPDAPAIWVPDVDGVENTGVFNEYASFGIPDADPEWTAPVFGEDFADVELTSAAGTSAVDPTAPVDLTVLPASTVTTSARTDQTALILRDSMGGALSPYWSQQYAATWQIQHRYDDWSSPPNYAALVTQYHPDVVIVQLAERHLTNPPTAGSGF